MDGHEARVMRVRDAYREAHARFVARVAAAGPLADRVPPAGGWSVAQIAWHVAAVDTTFAGLIAGDRPSLVLPADFEERSWDRIAAEIPSKLQAPEQARPPADVRVDDALAALEQGAARFDAALQSLTPERGSRHGITHRITATINLYQVGEWAVAHTIRHNAQAKRVLAAL